MSKTSLSHIDKSFNEVLEQQAVAGIPASVKKRADAVSTRSVSGFVMPDPATRAKVINTHLESMKKYAVDRAAVITDLTKLDIPVLATLPKAVWNNICKSSGLVQLCPAENGTVRIDATEIEKKLSQVAELKTLWGALIVGVIVSYITMYFGLTPETTGQWTIFAMFCGIPGLLVTGILLGVGIGEPLQYLLFARSVRRLGETGLMKLVSFGGNSYPTQLRLPDPPKDVCETLLKASTARLSIQIAAVPEAISFNPSLKAIVYATQAKRKAEEAIEAARLSALRADPIVYIERNGVIAVIAQFGDFPIEQALIDKLVSQEVVEEAY